jgi:hypothetical protein
MPEFLFTQHFCISDFFAFIQISKTKQETYITAKMLKKFSVTETMTEHHGAEL